MTTVPVILQQINILGEKRQTPMPSSLRMLMVTGSNLSSKVREDFSRRFNLPVYNYYGLTETARVLRRGISGNGSSKL